MVNDSIEIIGHARFRGIRTRSWISGFWRGLSMCIVHGMLGGLTHDCNAQLRDVANPRSTEIPRSFLMPVEATDLTLFAATVPEVARQVSISSGLEVRSHQHGIAIDGTLAGKAQSVRISSGSKPWDLSRFLYLVADVRNDEAEPITIITRVEDPDYAGWHHFAESVARVGAGQSASLLVFLKRKNGAEASLQKLFPGMHAMPDGYMPSWSGLNPAKITRVVFTVESLTNTVKLELLGLRASGVCDPAPLMDPDYFPFVDAYGQFRYATWPEKIHAPEDFKTQRKSELAALNDCPRPISWDKFGGFKSGPQLAATGHFRIEKYRGKWWLVDPEGHLFWSHGITGVGFAASTPARWRRQFFAKLPPDQTIESAKGVNFYLANARLKYGEGFSWIAPAFAHERLQSWGLNTLGAWTETAVSDLKKTPYTKILYIDGPKLAPDSKLPDPFDPAFLANARLAFSDERNSSGKDPWCIGYFIANELEWKNGPELVNEVLTAPALTAGKQAFVRLLQSRHSTIEHLNVVWHTTYDSWAAVSESTNKIAINFAIDDFTAFNEQLADRYFSICALESKRATPDKLNLGSRFHTLNPAAVRAAARYCDVVSFNKYATSIQDLRLPDGLDRPIMIGEFHFPAGDRAFTAHGQRSILSQIQRAEAYAYYVKSALNNPLVVGVHWFQYLDQPISGRADGENWPIGFVDITDTPYQELTATTRELGTNMYDRRLGLNPSAMGKQSAPRSEASMSSLESHSAQTP